MVGTSRIRTGPVVVSPHPGGLFSSRRPNGRFWHAFHATLSSLMPGSLESVTRSSGLFRFLVALSHVPSHPVFAHPHADRRDVLYRLFWSQQCQSVKSEPSNGSTMQKVLVSSAAKTDRMCSCTSAPFRDRVSVP